MRDVRAHSVGGLNTFSAKFIMEEPFPMLEEPTTWTAWEICAGARDDLTNLDEPFATIAKAFLDR